MPCRFAGALPTSRSRCKLLSSCPSFENWLSGFAAAKWGAPVTIATGGVISMAAAAVFRWRLPSIRTDARRLIDAAQEVV